MAKQRRFTKEQRQDRDKIYKRLPHFPFYIEEYIEDMLESEASPSTLLGYLNDIEIFFNWLMAEGLTTVSEHKDISLDILEHLPLKNAKSFFSFLKNHKELSLSAVNRKKSALRSLFKFLTERTEDEDGESYFYRNVMAKIKVNKDTEDLSARAERLSPLIIKPDTMINFLDFLQNEYESQLSDKTIKLAYFKRDRERDIAIIALLFATGIRVSELVNLQLNDLYLSKLRLSVLRKGGKEAIIRINRFAIPYLNNYLSIRKERYQATDDMPYVFVKKHKNHAEPLTIRSVQYIVEKYANAYSDIDGKRSPHKFRHSFATAYAQYNSLHDVMRQLGHTSTDTSMLYVNADEQAVDEAMDRLEEGMFGGQKLE